MNDQLRMGFAVAFGGGLGTLARSIVASAAVSWGSGSLWGVLVVNLVGALILGWYVAHVRGSKRWSTITVGFVAAGVLGSFTTFSAFSLEVVELYESGAWLVGSAYVFASVAAGLSAAIAGRRLAGAR